PTHELGTLGVACSRGPMGPSATDQGAAAPKPPRPVPGAHQRGLGRTSSHPPCFHPGAETTNQTSNFTSDRDQDVESFAVTKESTMNGIMHLGNKGWSLAGMGALLGFAMSAQGCEDGLGDLAEQCGLTCPAEGILEGNASISGI